MNTLRVLGDPPNQIVRRLVDAWPGRVVGPRDDVAGPFSAILVWDEEPEEMAAVLHGQREHHAWWLHTRAAGVSPALLRAMAGHDAVFTKGSGAHAIAVAEHVVAVLLALCKRIPDLLAAASARRWEVPADIRELRGSTVTVLGFGAIGSATAQLVTGFGATVIGVRRTCGNGRELLPVSRLRDALRRSGVLVVTAPLTSATRGLIGATELSAMPVGSLLVNVGRGPIVQEDALVTALVSGQLAGAALDVFDVEPLPRDSRLWDLPNVVISPHCADATQASANRALDVFLANARRWHQGQCLHGRVDLVHGY